MITEMNAAAAKALQSEVSDALKEIAQRHGLDYKAKAGAYDHTMFRGGGSFLLRAVGGVGREQMEFNDACLIYDLKTEDYGKVAKVSGVDFRLVGLNTRRTQKPLIMQRVSDGKRFIGGLDLVERFRAAPCQT
jgi:hypothetical protein